MFKIDKNRQNNHANRTADALLMRSNSTAMFVGIMPQIKEKTP
jgi:hypothetical protein